MIITHLIFFPSQCSFPSGGCWGHFPSKLLSLEAFFQVLSCEPRLREGASNTAGSCLVTTLGVSPARRGSRKKYGKAVMQLLRMRTACGDGRERLHRDTFCPRAKIALGCSPSSSQAASLGGLGISLVSSSKIFLEQELLRSRLFWPGPAWESSHACPSEFLGSSVYQ